MIGESYLCGEMKLRDQRYWLFTDINKGFPDEGTGEK
jgi:hypothetical protein